MTDPPKKNGLLSKTCRTHLTNVFVNEKHKRREEIASKYLEKGNEREKDALKLCGMLLGGDFEKNTTRLTNDFIQGEPDTYIGIEIRKADLTLDTKVSWSAFTFFRSQDEKIPSDYYWQGMGYMMLTGATKHIVAYCLVNATSTIIMDEKRKLAYKMGLLDMNGVENPVYIAKCKQIEVNHIFDINAFYEENPYFDFHNSLEEWSYDIPEKDRLFYFTVDRDEEAIKKITTRVKDCRDYMNKNLFKVAPSEIAKSKIKKMKALQKKVGM